MFTRSPLIVAKLGSSILRHIAKPFSKDEILSNDTKQLIQDMIKTMQKEDALGSILTKLYQDC